MQPKQIYKPSAGSGLDYLDISCGVAISTGWEFPAQTFQLFIWWQLF
jgi:hypothetical protein